ncbi:MAG TPA: hypothetical protein ENN21_01370 [Spirochaetes bacterium]|nr:hypothetical protein [Spirochaetota bacterium]
MLKTAMIFSLTAFLFHNGYLYAAPPTGFDYYGAVSTGKKGPCEQFEKKDGTRILKCPDREEARLPDGTFIEVFPDGKKKIRSADGSLLLIDFEGTRIYRSPDGKEKTVSMDGKTPYGLAIEPVEKTLTSGENVLVIRYNNMKSDDILDGEYKKFWDGLLSGAGKRISSRSSRSAFSGTIELSLCRFSRTGYCRRQNRTGLTAELYKGTAFLKSFTFSAPELRKPDLREKLIGTVLDAVLSD